MTPLGRVTAAVIGGVSMLLLLWDGSGPLGAGGPGPFGGPAALSPAPAPTQVVAQALGKGPWTVRGYGYEFTVVRITHTVGPFGPNEGKPCLRVVATVERYQTDDHRAMEVVVTDEQQRVLALDPFSGKGTMEPSMHRKTQLEMVAVVQGGKAARLTFMIRGHFWPDGKDLILESVPVPR